MPGKVGREQICLRLPRVWKEKAKKEDLLDILGRGGGGLVYQSVDHLLATAARWGIRRRRFLKIHEEWGSHGPDQEAGAKVVVGLLKVADATQTHSYTCGIGNFEHAEFVRMASGKAGSGPYFGPPADISTINPKSRWRVHS